MFEESIDKEPFDLFELREQVIEFLVVVFFDALHFLAHSAQLRDLVFNFILELSDLPL